MINVIKLKTNILRRIRRESFNNDHSTQHLVASCQIQ